MTPQSLLFEEPINGLPLFKSQLELVNELLSTPSYYKHYESDEERQKAQNRLKSYLSQILSGSVTRNITDQFIAGLYVVLKRRITDQTKLDETYNSVIQLLKDRQEVAKTSFKATPVVSSLLQSKYVSIIATRPFESYNIQITSQEKEIVRIFLDDIMQYILTGNKPARAYRFNFPLKQHATLMWHNIQKSIFNVLIQQQDDSSFISQFTNESLLMKIPAESFTKAIQQLKHGASNSLELKTSITSSFMKPILEYFQSTNFIKIFHVDELIFSLPIIAFNPDVYSTGHLYSVIEEEGKGLNFIKVPREDMSSWKYFVWDKLKVSENVHEVSPAEHP